MRRLTLIPCGGAKLDQLAPARELYTGSMFRDTLRTAEMLGDEVLILSAKFGLLGLDDEVQPYDLKMGDAGSVTSHFIAEQLRHRVFLSGDVARMLLPKAYAKVMAEACHRVGMRSRDLYAGSRGIGDQKAILAQLRRKCSEVAA